MQKLQDIAKKLDILITLNAVPGTFSIRYTSILCGDREQKLRD
jgi:hypothetical protein